MDQCQYFRKCGGCTLQHLDHTLQIQNKKDRLSKLIHHPVTTIIQGNPWEYRNRMDFIFTSKGIGLRKIDNAKQTLPIAQCPISEKPINHLLRECIPFFKNIDAYNHKKQTGTFKHLVIRTAQTTSLSFVLNRQSSRINQATQRIEQFCKITSADHVIVTYVDANDTATTSQQWYPLKGNGILSTVIKGKTIQYDAQCFFQNNHTMAQKMHDHTSQILEKVTTRNWNLVDLYAGVGVFSLVNAHLFSQCTALESFEPCLKLAQENCLINQIQNITFINKDAGHITNQSIQKPLAIITDPPRSGMDTKTIQWINTMRADVLIVISCNPSNLPGELAQLSSYKINQATLIDMFPHTNHMEALIVLNPY